MTWACCTATRRRIRSPWTPRNATRKVLGVAVKCATITPNAQRDGGVPQLDRDVEKPERHHPLHPGRHGLPRADPASTASSPWCSNWKKPITIARHAYGDVYKSRGAMHTDEPGECTMTFTRRDRQGADRPRAEGRRSRPSLQGAAQQGIDASAPLPSACFQYAIDTQAGPVVLHQGHHRQGLRRRRSSSIFEEEYEQTYKDEFEAAGHRPISTPSSTTRWPASSAAEGGFIWACKNYDGDVMSDMVSTAFGSPGHDDLRARLARRHYGV